MSHDPQNPISNETGEYLQEVTEKREEKRTPEVKPKDATPRKNVLRKGA